MALGPVAPNDSILIRSRPIKTTITVKTASTVVLPDNPARKGLFIQNIGTVPITVELSGPAVLGQGLILNLGPNHAGDYLNFMGPVVPCCTVNAIAKEQSTLSVYEFV